MYHTPASRMEFRAKNRNKHARTLTVRQVPSWKNGGIFVDRLTKEVTNFTCFLNIPGKQQHFNLTNRKLVNCFHGESIFFGQN